jgi:hemerythrin-like metal-binding protein
MPQKGRRSVRLRLIGKATLSMNPTVSIPTTGIAEIDRQHSELIALLERLEMYSDSPHRYAAMLDVVIRLKRYSVAHFSYEESMLKRAGYPELEAHIALHRQFDEQLHELQRHVCDEDAEPIRLAGFMKDWLIKHIGIEDRRYVDYLDAHPSS